ncbi:MAG: hypothetical protein WD850_01620 [Candidatus Spechtbacterales bacterium]
MAIQTKKQKQQKQFGLLVVVAMLGVAMFLVWRFGKEGLLSPAGIGAADTVRSEMLRRQADIALPKNLFQDRVLQQFTPYNPAEAPENPGRENPFAPI